MLSLPILFREFRSAARRQRTYMMRVLFGVLLALVAFVFVVAHRWSPSTWALGHYLMNTYAWELFALVFVIGPALTCGCISDERKAGTLDLLFLTHLNSADIVLGKLIGKGFDAFMLLAVTAPFLFIPILLGGVNWDTTVALGLILLAQLVLGLAVGVLTSTLARGTATAFAVAYLFLAAYNFVLASLPWLKRVADFMFVTIGSRSFDLNLDALAWLAHLAPFHALLTINKLTTRDASITLLSCVVLASLFLAASIWRLPRAPAEARRRANRLASGGWTQLLPTLSRIDRPNRRWLDRNPLLWLGFARKRRRVWLQVGLVVFASCAAWVMGDAGFLAIVFGWLSWMALKLIIVVDVARTFASEKEDGSMEMLLTAPFTDKRIVNSGLAAVLFRYAIPCLAIGAFVVIAAVFENLGWLSLLILLLMASELICVICMAMLISVKARTTTQAITISVAAAVFTSTFLKGFLPLCPCSFLGEPLVALIAYLILTSGFRRYAAR